MPIRTLTPAAEASFVAYTHYLEDLAGIISGAFGDGVDGVYATLHLHPPVRALPRRSPSPAETAAIHGALQSAWTALAAIDNAVQTGNRQANAVVPGFASAAVVQAGRALGVVLGAEGVTGDDEVLALLGDAAAEELFPYPWSAFCDGCPQLGSTVYGGSVLPGDPVSVFHAPRADTSDARVAMLLRTTRQRILEREFARQRQIDVAPGRSRRNLSREHKELLAATVAPTTLFDVLERIRVRVVEDDGEAFVDAPFDDVDAVRLSEALALVSNASVAVVEGVLAAVIGWDRFAELVDSHARRAAARAVDQRRLAARNRSDSSA